jgi:putative sigma-54 modulation protein
MERYKGKHYRGRGTNRIGEDLALAEEEPAEEESPVIARRKRFVLDPMDELEAVEQMTMLGHENFFVFFNANSNTINVLYRRRDGTYGLIEPEVR